MANIRAALMALTSGSSGAQGVATSMVLGSNVVLVSNLNEKVHVHVHTYTYNIIVFMLYMYMENLGLH